MFLFILQESETGQGYYSAPSPNPSVDSSGDGDGKKKRRPKFIRIVDCHVCGDKANDHIHYGAICKFTRMKGLCSMIARLQIGNLKLSHLTTW